MRLYLKNMREKQVDEEEPNALAQVVETTVFDGEIAEVATMAQFREAIDNPDIGGYFHSSEYYRDNCKHTNCESSVTYPRKWVYIDFWNQ